MHLNWEKLLCRKRPSDNAEGGILESGTPSILARSPFGQGPGNRIGYF